MIWYNKTLHKWRELLEGKDAIQDGEPNPEVVKILSDIDLLRLKPARTFAEFGSCDIQRR